MTSLKNSIKQSRIEKRLTVRELALLSGVSPAHITQIENENRNPTLSVARKISKALKQSLNEVFPEENSTTKNAV